MAKIGGIKNDADKPVDPPSEDPNEASVDEVVTPEVAAYWEKLNLKHDPFADSDSGYFHLSEWEQHLDLLHHLLHYSNVLLSIVGAPGLGKSTLLQQFLAQVDNETLQAYAIKATTEFGKQDLVAAISKAFSISSNENDTPEARLEKLLNELQYQNVQSALLIDDAELLSDDMFEMMLNLVAQQSDNQVHFHLVLFGDAGLEKRISQLGKNHREEIMHTIELTPLSLKESQQYLGEKLIQAGLQGNFPLSESQVNKIWKEANGNPKLINQQAQKLLEKIAAKLQTKGGIPEQVDHSRSGQGIWAQHKVRILIGMGLLLIFILTSIVASVLVSEEPEPPPEMLLDNAAKTAPAKPEYKVEVDLPSIQPKLRTVKATVPTLASAASTAKPATATSATIPAATPVVSTTNGNPVVSSPTVAKQEVDSAELPTIAKPVMATKTELALKSKESQVPALPMAAKITPPTLPQLKITPRGTEKAATKKEAIKKSAQQHAKTPEQTIFYSPGTTTTTAPNKLSQVSSAVSGQKPVKSTMTEDVDDTPTVSHESPTYTINPHNGAATKPADAKTASPVKAASKPQPAQALSSQGVKIVSALSADEKALLALPKHGYTIQIIAVKSLTSIKNLQRKGIPGRVYLFETRRNGHPWYIVTAGDYRTRAEATTAITRMPKHIRQLRPWVKPITSVQNEIRRR